MPPSSPLLRAFARRARSGAPVIVALALGVLLVVAAWSSAHLEVDSSHSGHTAVTAVSVLHDSGHVHHGADAPTSAHASPEVAGLCFLGAMCGLLVLVLAAFALTAPPARGVSGDAAPRTRPVPAPGGRAPLTPDPLSELSISRT